MAKWGRTVPDGHGLGISVHRSFLSYVDGEITAKNGAVVQGNFPDWRVMRINEAPHKVDVHVMESDAPPGGVGEPGTPTAAPALANAIFAATGQRLRSLPLLGQNDRLNMTKEG